MVHVRNLICPHHALEQIRSTLIDVELLQVFPFQKRLESIFAVIKQLFASEGGLQ
jgi:hypothetical protein